jgi:hypothetical protein
MIDVIAARSWAGRLLFWGWRRTAAGGQPGAALRLLLSNVPGLAAPPRPELRAPPPPLCPQVWDRQEPILASCFWAACHHGSAHTRPAPAPAGTRTGSFSGSAFLCARARSLTGSLSLPRPLLADPELTRTAPRKGTWTWSSSSRTRAAPTRAWPAPAAPPPSGPPAAKGATPPPSTHTHNTPRTHADSSLAERVTLVAQARGCGQVPRRAAARGHGRARRHALQARPLSSPHARRCVRADAAMTRT